MGWSRKHLGDNLARIENHNIHQTDGLGVEKKDHHGDEDDSQGGSVQKEHGGNDSLDRVDGDMRMSRRGKNTEKPYLDHIRLGSKHVEVRIALETLETHQKPTWVLRQLPACRC